MNKKSYLFDLRRWYCKDPSIMDPYRNYMIYDGQEFICTGLTQLQAEDWRRGASLKDLGILQCML